MTNDSPTAATSRLSRTFPSVTPPPTIGAQLRYVDPDSIARIPGVTAVALAVDPADPAGDRAVRRQRIDQRKGDEVPLLAKKIDVGIAKELHSAPKNLPVYEMDCIWRLSDR